MNTLNTKISTFGAFLTLVCGLILSNSSARAQCPNRVEHLSGTQTIACTDVTVTSEGGAGTGPGCDGGPYLIGNPVTGSYTFTFSPPVAGVLIGVSRIDNHDFWGLGHEEVVVTVNGVHFDLTNNGSPSCDPLQAVVNTSGNLAAPDCGDPNCSAAADGIQIDQTITTLNIRDVYIVQPQAGIFFSLYFCCSQCLVDAGVLEPDPINLCPGSVASVPPASLTYLPAGTLLQYILFADPADTLGSVLATSNTPSFSFNPANMQFGKTYYIASVAGDNQGGNVDPNSYCLDFSNAVEVTWWPKPAVVFSVDNTNVCLGACNTVTATFTGTAPYSLTYKTSLSGPVTATFDSDTGTFEVCATGNALPGPLSIQATSLTDAHCTCN